MSVIDWLLWLTGAAWWTVVLFAVFMLAGTWIAEAGRRRKAEPSCLEPMDERWLERVERGEVPS